MGTESVGRRRVRFGAFEVDLGTGELFKNGTVTRLSPQPCKILTLLISHPGELVTREEIHEKVWGNDTFVDFENGLNFAIKRIRTVLGDDPESPRYIETLPKRGYRFVAPIDNIDAVPPAVTAAGQSSSVLEPSAALAQVEPPPASTSSAVTPGAGAPVGGVREPFGQKRRLAAMAATAVTGIALVAAGWLWHDRSRLAAPADPLIPIPLTSYPGHEDSPSFSPDGTQVAFSWDGEKGDNYDIYVKVIGSDPPLRLTTDPAPDFSPAWSPDGRWIAFYRALSGGRHAVVLVPPVGGRERTLIEGFDNNSPPLDPPYLAWSPDSRWLAVVGAEKVDGKPEMFLISLETGEKHKLLPTSVSPLNVTCPAFSPDGRTLAFVGWISPSSRDLYLLDLTPDLRPVGRPRRLTFGNWVAASAAWAQDGRSLIFSTSDSAETSLWRVDASGSGKPQRLAVIGANGTHPAISRRGNFLAYVRTLEHVSIWRIGNPTAGGKASPPRKFIASTRDDYSPRFSPDGKKISFRSNRSGSTEIWLCDSDGSHPVQLTSLGGPVISSTPEWSPDGRHLTFELDSGEHHDVYVVDANGGSPKRLTSMPGYSENPSWSRDGRSIFFNNVPPDECCGILKIPAEGGSAVIIANKAGWEPMESPDGRFIYSMGDSVDNSALLRTLRQGGATQTVLPSGVDPLSYLVVQDGIYFISTSRLDSGYSIQFLNTTTGKIHRIAAFKNMIWGSLAVSPDRRWILYSQTDENAGDLMLVKNFR